MTSRSIQSACRPFGVLLETHTHFGSGSIAMSWAVYGDSIQWQLPVTSRFGYPLLGSGPEAVLRARAFPVCVAICRERWCSRPRNVADTSTIYWEIATP